ncbi:apolipophorins-like [Octopus vulgaris]|uniref:Apolipophorins-like n=1 Tax=Octopus vulgaris TaxID=6645 RepID=A0AA36BYX5_OCTVU|nr:apolipophorins-like [Octopus vulgaris]
MSMSEIALNYKENLLEEGNIDETLFQQPVHFSFHNEEIKTLWEPDPDPKSHPNPLDMEQVMNIKKGVLSLFQNSLDSFHRSKSLIETDVLGKCLTHYEVDPFSDSFSYLVTKKKDLDNCEGRQHYINTVHSVNYGDDTVDTQPSLTKISYLCKQSFSKKSNTLTSATCSERHVFGPFSHDVNGAYSSQVQTLQYMFTHKTDIARFPDRSTTVTDLLFRYHTGHSNIDNKDIRNILSIMQLLCLKYSDDVRPEFPEILEGLVSAMRQVDASGLMNTHEIISNQDFCQAKTNHVRQYFLDAVPMVQTLESVKFIVQMIYSQQIGETDAMLWLTAISLIFQPSKEMVAACKPLLHMKDAPQNMALALSSLIWNYCRTIGDACQQDPTVGTFLQQQEALIVGDGDGADTAYTYHPGEKTTDVLMALRAIGNLGYFQKILAHVARCFTRRDNPSEIRVAAIEAMRRTRCGTTIPGLNEVFSDDTEDSELRIQAYIILMRCPSHKFLLAVHNILLKGKSNQVGSYIWSHLNNLAETTGPYLQEIHTILEDVVLKKEFDLDDRKFSHYYEKSLYSTTLDVGAKLDSNVIFSSKSFIPRSTNLNLTMHLFGRAVNFLEVGGRAQAVDQILENFFGPMGFFSDPLTSNTKTIKLSEGKKNMKSKPIDREKFLVSFYIRVFGNEIHYSDDFSFDKASKLLKYLLTPEHFKVTRSFSLLDTETVLPTCSGLPLHLKITSTGSFGLHGSKFLQLPSFSAALKPRSDMYLIHGARTKLLTADMEIDDNNINSKKKNKICSSEQVLAMTGLRLCQEVNIPSVFLLKRGPFIPLTGPLVYDLHLIKEDMPEGVLITIIPFDNSNILTVDTPESKQQRTVFIMATTKEEYLTVDVVSPWRDVNMKVVPIKNEKYEKVGVRILLNDDNKLYTASVWTKTQQWVNGSLSMTQLDVTRPDHTWSVKSVITQIPGKKVQVDVSSEGFKTRNMLLTLSKSVVIDATSIMGTLKIGPDTYTLQGGLDQPWKKTGFKYVSYLKVTDPQKTVLDFSAGISNEPGKRFLVDVKLDKVYSKLVSFYGKQLEFTADTRYISGSFSLSRKFRNSLTVTTAQGNVLNTSLSFADKETKHFRSLAFAVQFSTHNHEILFSEEFTQQKRVPTKLTNHLQVQWQKGQRLTIYTTFQNYSGIVYRMSNKIHTFSGRTANFSSVFLNTNDHYKATLQLNADRGLFLKKKISYFVESSLSYKTNPEGPSWELVLNQTESTNQNLLFVAVFSVGKQNKQSFQLIFRNSTDPYDKTNFDITGKHFWLNGKYHSIWSFSSTFRRMEQNLTFDPDGIELTYAASSNLVLYKNDLSRFVLNFTSPKTQKNTVSKLTAELHGVHTADASVQFSKTDNGYDSKGKLNFNVLDSKGHARVDLSYSDFNRLTSSGIFYWHPPIHKTNIMNHALLATLMRNSSYKIVYNKKDGIQTGSSYMEISGVKPVIIKTSLYLTDAKDIANISLRAENGNNPYLSEVALNFYYKINDRSLTSMGFLKILPYFNTSHLEISLVKGRVSEAVIKLTTPYESLRSLQLMVSYATEFKVSKTITGSLKHNENELMGLNLNQYFLNSNDFGFTLYADAYNRRHERISLNLKYIVKYDDLLLNLGFKMAPRISLSSFLKKWSTKQFQYSLKLRLNDEVYKAGISISDKTANSKAVDISLATSNIKVVVVWLFNNDNKEVSRVTYQIAYDGIFFVLSGSYLNQLGEERVNIHMKIFHLIYRLFIINSREPGKSKKLDFEIQNHSPINSEMKTCNFGEWSNIHIVLNSNIGLKDRQNISAMFSINSTCTQHFIVFYEFSELNKYENRKSVHVTCPDNGLSGTVVVDSSYMPVLKNNIHLSLDTRPHTTKGIKPLREHHHRSDNLVDSIKEQSSETNILFVTAEWINNQGIRVKGDFTKQKQSVYFHQNSTATTLFLYFDDININTTNNKAKRLGLISGQKSSDRFAVSLKNAYLKLIQIHLPDKSSLFIWVKIPQASPRAMTLSQDIKTLIGEMRLDFGAVLKIKLKFQTPSRTIQASGTFENKQRNPQSFDATVIYYGENNSKKFLLKLNGENSSKMKRLGISVLFPQSKNEVKLKVRLSGRERNILMSGKAVFTLSREKDGPMTLVFHSKLFETNGKYRLAVLSENLYTDMFIKLESFITLAPGIYDLELYSSHVTQRKEMTRLKNLKMYWSEKKFLFQILSPKKEISLTASVDAEGTYQIMVRRLKKEPLREDLLMEGTLDTAACSFNMKLMYDPDNVTNMYNMMINFTKSGVLFMDNINTGPFSSSSSNEALFELRPGDILYGEMIWKPNFIKDISNYFSQALKTCHKEFQSTGQQSIRNIAMSFWDIVKPINQAIHTEAKPLIPYIKAEFENAHREYSIYSKILVDHYNNNYLYVKSFQNAMWKVYDYLKGGLYGQLLQYRSRVWFEMVKIWEICQQIFQYLYDQYKVKVGGIEVNLPMTLTSGIVFRTQEAVTLESSRGYQVTLNFETNLVVVEISGWYFNKVAGLFGTYNNEPHDDFNLVTQEERALELKAGPGADLGSSGNLEMFAMSWTVSENCKSLLPLQINQNMIVTPDKKYDVTINDGDDKWNGDGCARLFLQKSSQFRNCFKQVTPGYFYKMCTSAVPVDTLRTSSAAGTPSKDNLCAVSSLYIRECQRQGVPLTIPMECLFCLTRNETKVQQGDFFGVVGFGGNYTAPVYTRTFYGQTMSDSLKVSDVLYEINYETDQREQPLDIMQALTRALHYPFRAGAMKTIILVTCSSCQDNNVVSFELKEALREQDVILHVLAEENFKSVGNISLEKAHIYGANQRNIYPIGTNKLANVSGHQIVPDDSCAQEAIHSKGSYFNTKKLNKVTTSRSFMQTFCAYVALSLKQNFCQNCQCVPRQEGYRGHLLCHRCPQLPHDIVEEIIIT